MKGYGRGPYFGEDMQPTTQSKDYHRNRTEWLDKATDCLMKLTEEIKMDNDQYVPEPNVAELKARILALESLLDNIHDTLLEYEDVDDGDDGRQVANFAMSINQSIDEIMGRGGY